ncbi:MAG: methyl-accepting chemotaxis protein [Proteobacteria bacterium]|nr:methyl-accepting chemotaxis protein [Pseudomonadota bacterium]
MVKFSDWSLMKKMLASGIGILLVFSIVIFVLYALVARSNSIDAYVEKARAICLTAESTRQEMEDKWTLGLFNQEQLVAFSKAGDKKRMLSTIPVVSAWMAAMRKAEQGNYQFRVPKFSPRNPTNEPDYGLNYQVEGPALKKIKAENLEEYYVIDENINAIRYFLPVVLSDVCLNCHGDPSLSKTMWGRDDGKDPTGGTMENWHTGEIHGAFEVIQSLEVADSERYTKLMGAVGITLVIIILACLTLYFIARSITKPLTKGVEFAKKMSEGDLSQTLDIEQKDETGDLAEAMNTMITSLSSIIREILDGVLKLTNSAEELSGISHQMNTTSQTTSDKSNVVAAAAEEMSVNMNTVAAAVEETSTNVGMVSNATTQLSETINETAKNTENSRSITGQAVIQAQNASEKVNELGAAAEEISLVTETITVISDKINLLALNATIEAARAGDAGKGFAVVANEIKELAKQTSDATQKIRQRIEGIQRSTSETVEQIQNITKVINDVNEIVTSIATTVEEQSVTTREISSNVAEASAGIKEVTENITQSSDVSHEVARDIADVNAAAEEISGNSSHVNEKADELSSLAEQLKTLVSKFSL